MEFARFNICMYNTGIRDNMEQIVLLPAGSSLAARMTRSCYICKQERAVYSKMLHVLSHYFVREKIMIATSTRRYQMQCLKYELFSTITIISDYRTVRLLTSRDYLPRSNNLKYP